MSADKKNKNKNNVQKAKAKNEQTATQTAVKKSLPLWEILSFVLPILLLGIGFYVIKIYPFGNR